MERWEQGKEGKRECGGRGSEARVALIRNFKSLVGQVAGRLVAGKIDAAPSNCSAVDRSSVDRSSNIRILLGRPRLKSLTEQHCPS